MQLEKVGQMVFFTKYTVMTLMAPSIDTSRAKRLVKLLKRLIAQEHLYSDEQLIDMKKQLKVVQEEMDGLNRKLKKGFG
tara:strand:- start:2635 stop:2871 length:237 start_codon:yes stop_codon:yes gene_type:complete